MDISGSKRGALGNIAVHYSLILLLLGAVMYGQRPDQNLTADKYLVI
jgi:hypothetical protein